MLTQSEQLELFSDAPFSMRLTVEEGLRIFCENYWNRLPMGKNSKAHIKRVLFFFKNHHLDTVSKHDVENFRIWLKESGLRDSTINKAHTTLIRMYSKLAEYKEAGVVNGIDFSKITLPNRNPASLVPKVNEDGFARKTVVSPEEFKILRSCADNDLRDILNMLIWTRSRPGDLRRVAEQNINWHTRQIEGIQHKTITTKNPSGVPYFWPITTRMESLLRERISMVRPGTQLFSWHNMAKRWDRARRLSGLLLVQMRDLRRSGASYLADNGTDEITISQGLGHTSTDTTRTYIPRKKRHFATATEKLVEAF